MDENKFIKKSKARGKYSHRKYEPLKWISKIKFVITKLSFTSFTLKK